jgi:hypothetical protein
LLRALRVLDPRHRFQVIAYHHQCLYLLQPRLLLATQENMLAISGHLNGLAAFGGTDHEQALVTALSLRPDVIFLLSDGGEPDLSGAARQRIQRMAQGRTSIHCVQFGFRAAPPTESFLQRLATENGGGYRYVDMSRG